MRSRALFAAIAALAVATTTVTLPTDVHAGAYPVNKCVSAKMRAASSNCKSVLAAWSKYLSGGGSDAAGRDAAIAAAGTKLTTAWGKAETKSAKKSVDCVDTTMSAADANLQIATDAAAIAANISLGLTLSTKADAKCGGALAKAAATQCAALLKSESGYITKLASGTAKRDAANSKADAKFTAAVSQALTGCASGATAGSLDTGIDALVQNVITDTTISPNVDNTQFDTISPAFFPTTPYLGAELSPLCSFGTPYHFFVKRGTVNKLVMYYQGGGACWNALTCGVVGTFDKDVNPSGSDNPNNTTTGFGDLTNPANPFKDWNIVFVSYCTGDIHFGDSNPAYTFGSTTYNTRHFGWHNARIAEKFAREHFVNPDEIFVTGSSAGAYGAFFNAPLHHDVWPDSKFTVLADAGNGIITPDFLSDRFPVWNFASHLPPNIPGVLEAIDNAGGIPAYTKAVADYFPDTAWAHYTSSYDGGTGGQTGFYNVMSNDTESPTVALATWPNWWNASCDWRALMRHQAITTSAAVPANYRYYIGTGSRHTMYGSNKVYTDTTGGVPTITAWINSMLARDSGWTNIECTLPECGALLPGDPEAPQACNGGANDNAQCTTDSECPGGSCTEYVDPFNADGPGVRIDCP